MSLDLVHFPNYKKTFFGSSFQSDTLALLTRIRDEIGCRYVTHTYRGRVGDCTKVNSADLTVLADAACYLGRALFLEKLLCH